MKAKWIDINTKKPKEGIRVLVYPVDNTEVVISRIENDSEFGERWHDDDHNTFEMDTVKYWMELPDKPNYKH